MFIKVIYYWPLTFSPGSMKKNSHLRHRDRQRHRERLGKRRPFG